MAIKLIATDLDGTLLSNNKTISEYTKNTLRKAAERGVYIVPITGRLFEGIPEDVRTLDFLKYSINVNGSTIYDYEKKEFVYSIGMTPETALRVIDFVEQYDIIYDAYIDEWGYMSFEAKKAAEKIIPEPFLTLIKLYRKPVEDLREFITTFGKPVEKIQLFSDNSDVVKEVFDAVREKFPEVDATSSLENNIEVCDINANKGKTLLRLADMLGIKPSEIMALGDGGNDIEMLKLVGLPIAPENARDQVKAVCKDITASCNEDGVAKAIEKYILNV